MCGPQTLGLLCDSRSESPSRGGSSGGILPISAPGRRPLSCVTRVGPRNVLVAVPDFGVGCRPKICSPRREENLGAASESPDIGRLPCRGSVRGSGWIRPRPVFQPGGADRSGPSSSRDRWKGARQVPAALDRVGPSVRRGRLKRAVHHTPGPPSPIAIFGSRLYSEQGMSLG